MSRIDLREFCDDVLAPGAPMASRPTCGLQELQSTRSLRAGGPLKLVAQTPLLALKACSGLHVCSVQGFQLHADGEGHEQGLIGENSS